MQVELFRIDDRLIHGQVISGWSRCTGATRVLIIDDIVATDELSLQLFKMASPPGVSIEAYSVEDGVEVLKQDGSDKTIVLFRTPVEAKKVFDSGVPMPKLNVGGMGSNAKRKKFYKNVHLSPDEETVLRGLSSQGVTVEFQMVPDHKAQNIDNI